MKLIKFLIIFLIFSFKFSYAYDPNDFNNWKLNFKKIALKNNISENTFNLVMSNVQYLPKVIEYDRFQPEFYEDTKTYLSKRTSKKKVLKGMSFFNNNSKLINTVETKYNIEKELLL